MFHLETVSAEGFPAKELDNTFSAKLRLSKMVENCFLYISIKKIKTLKYTVEGHLWSSERWSELELVAYKNGLLFFKQSLNETI